MNLIFVLQPWLDLCGPEMIVSSFIILIHELPHLQLRGPLGGTPRIDLIASQASYFALYFFLRFSGVDAEYRYIMLYQNSGSSTSNMSCQHLPSDEPVLPCPMPFQTSFVGCLPTVPCHASMVQLREPHVKSVESDQVPVPLTDNHAGTAYVPSSMYLPKAAWFPLSPKTKELCTTIYWYVTNKLQTICSFNLAVSDQVLQRLEDAKQKTRGQCSILKELASYSTTAFDICYTDLNMSATSRQLDIWSNI